MVWKITLIFLFFLMKDETSIPYNNGLDCMPTCGECVSYFQKNKDRGDCRINGETTPDRDSERCPSRTFIPKPVK